MKRVVALEEGLEDIREYLQDKGFHVVDWGKGSFQVDAVVYRNSPLSEIKTEAIMSESDPMYFADRDSFGVLLVNAQNKTPHEIYEIIKNRIYEPII